MMPNHVHLIEVVAPFPSKRGYKERNSQIVMPDPVSLAFLIPLSYHKIGCGCVHYERLIFKIRSYSFPA